MSNVAELQSRDEVQALPRALSVVTTPTDMLRLVIERNGSIELVDKFMELLERGQRMQARMAYNAAVAKFCETPVQVLRSKTVSQGPLKGTNYAVLSDFVNASRPALSAAGLSATWKITRDEPTWIEVTCYLRHRDGHEEATPMGGPPDAGGAKNAIQARASTVSYLEKYTLKMALGLAEEDDDDDGNGHGDNDRRDPPPQRDPEKTDQGEPKPPYPADKFEKNFQSWTDLVTTGGKSTASVIATIQTRNSLTEEQVKKIQNIKVPA